MRGTPNAQVNSEISVKTISHSLTNIIHKLIKGIVYFDPKRYINAEQKPKRPTPSRKKMAWTIISSI